MRSRSAANGAIVLILSFSFLAGCALIDQNLAGRVVNLNRSLDQSTHDVTLTNIVRASNFQPLTFVAVSKVNSSQSVTLGNSFPTFTFGPGLTDAQQQYAFGGNNLSNNASGNFDVAPLTTRDFAKGVAADITLPELNLLQKQGIPRDLLFNLAVESIDYTDDKGLRKSFKNDPSDPRSYARFRAAILILVELGWSIEARVDKNPAFDAADKTTTRFITTGRFCFDETLTDIELVKHIREIAKQRRDRDARPMDRTWVCSTEWSKQPPQDPTNKEEPINVYLPEGRIALTNIVFRMRSIVGAFNFLGRLIADEKMDIARAATDREIRTVGIDLYDAAQFPEKNAARLYSIVTQTGAPQLRLVNGSGSCFASTTFNGERYCVPLQGSANTKQIFAILAQLIALKTAAGDLPSTPTVRVAP